MGFWILRSLRECKKESLSEAFYEVGTIVITSLVPIWLGTIVAIATANSRGPFGVLHHFFESTEAIVFSAALVGPLAYTITRSYGGLPDRITFRFPHALFFILMLLIIYGSATGILGTDFAKSLDENAQPQINTHSTAFPWISVTFFVLAVVILFIAYVLRNNIPTDAAGIMHNSSEDFLNEWKK